MLSLLGSIGAEVLELMVSFVMMLVFMFYYRWPLSKNILWLPCVVLGCCLSTSGLGLILSAWNVRFRDIKYAVPFFLQMGLFITPVIYPIEYVPARFRPLIALNPMTGVVMAARYTFLGGSAQLNLILLSLAVSLVLFVAGLFIFRRTETQFADIV